MITCVKLLLPIVLSTGAGYCLISFVPGSHRLPSWLKVGCGYGMGLGLVAVWMFLLGLMKIPYTFPTIAAALALLMVMYCVIRYRRGAALAAAEPLFPSRGRERRSAWWLILLLFVAPNIGYTIWRALTVPIIGYDAMATVGYKAKVIFIDGTLPDLNVLPHASYPLLVPFNLAWIALGLGEWSPILVQIIFPLTLMSFLAVQYYFVRSLAGTLPAMISVALLLCSNLVLYHAGISYRDLTLMYFNCSALLTLIWWFQNRLPVLLWISSLFAAFASFTKLEGTALLLLYYGLFLIHAAQVRKTAPVNRKNMISFFLPSLIVCIGFHIYKILVLDPTLLAEKIEWEFRWDTLSQASDLFLRIIENLFLTNNWNILWFVLLIHLLYLPRHWSRSEIRFLGLALAFPFVFYTLYALLSTAFVWIGGAQSATTLSRLILHFFPLAVTLMILLSRDKEPPD